MVVIYLLMQAIAGCKESVNIILHLCWEAYCFVNDSALGDQTFEFASGLQSKMKTISLNIIYFIHIDLCADICDDLVEPTIFRCWTNHSNNLLDFFCC